MKTWFIIIGVLVMIVITAVLTNPNTNKHKDAVKVTLKELLNGDTQQTVDTTNQMQHESTSIGSFLGDMFINPLVEKAVSSNNYLVFSTTQLTWFGETKTIGFGVFGKVYISKQTNELLNKAMSQPSSQNTR